MRYIFSIIYKIKFLVCKNEKIDTDILVNQDCFLAHCYTMSGHHGTLYERIDHAIKKRDCYEIPSSTIKAGDMSPQNYFADIGIILNRGLVTFCSPKDGNTYRLNGELIYDDEFGVENPDKNQILNAVVNRQVYNEFLLTNYLAIGIFISNDSYGRAHALSSMMGPISLFYNNTKDYKLPYYYLTQGNLDLLRFDETRDDFVIVKRVSILDLYS